MNREKMIAILVNYQIQICRYGGFTDHFEYYLYSGFKGYENLTNQEIKDEFEDLDSELIKDVLNTMNKEASERSHMLSS